MRGRKLRQGALLGDRRLPARDAGRGRAARRRPGLHGGASQQAASFREQVDALPDRVDAKLRRALVVERRQARDPGDQPVHRASPRRPPSSRPPARPRRSRRRSRRTRTTRRRDGKKDKKPKKEKAPRTTDADRAAARHGRRGRGGPRSGQPGRRHVAGGIAGDGRARRRDRGPLPARRAPRRGRHVDRLPGARRRARAPGGGQAAGRAPRRGRRRSSPASGARRWPPRSSCTPTSCRSTTPGTTRTRTATSS